MGWEMSETRERELVRLIFALCERIYAAHSILAHLAEKQVIPAAPLPLWKRIYRALARGSHSTPALVRILHSTRHRVWRSLRVMERKKLVSRRKGMVRNSCVAVWTRTGELT